MQYISQRNCKLNLLEKIKHQKILNLNETYFKKTEYCKLIKDPSINLCQRFYLITKILELK